MIKKAILIFGCLYLYVSFVSHEDKMEWFSKGVKAYQTVTQSLKDKNIQVDTKKWDMDQPLEEQNPSPPKVTKKKRSF